MNKIVQKFLLTGDKFKPELCLIQPGFTYSACGPLTKYRERIKKFREAGDLKHIYKNELDEACFPYDEAYSDSKHLAKRTIPDQFLKERTY